MEVLLMLSSILGQDFYNRVATYFNRENKKLRELKRYITFIWIKICISLDNNKKIHGFGLRYNLRKVHGLDS